MSNKEFENFDQTMRQIIKVSHKELKAKLDAEKKAKGRKTKASGPRASDAKRHGNA
ncbi:MAG TPA: hypothetical protein VK738_04135 [Terriglobales bacterium]|jgi:hypothetical protein|nr:hypothetical protein [Terriglobales bacterium]